MNVTCSLSYVCKHRECAFCECTTHERTVREYINKHTNMHTYIYTYIHTYIHTYIVT